MTAPMTWGQTEIWKPIKWYGDQSSYFNIKVAFDLPDDPAPVDLPTLLRVLRHLVERHQVLRSHYFDGPDGPCQQVLSEGAFTVILRESEPGAARETAEALAAEMGAACFDHEAEWPVRFGVVSRDGRPTHLAIAISHVAVDAAAMRLLYIELMELLRAPDDPRLPARTSREPLEQAAFEQSPQGQRRSRKALSYWRSKLERIPASMFDYETVEPEEPRFHKVHLESPALAVAADRLADACQASVSSALLTGTALVLGAISGRTTAALQLISANRLDEERVRMVAAAAQNGLFALDFATGTVAEAVRAGHRAGLAGYFYAHVDPARLDELTAQIEAARGEKIDLTVYFNDTRGDQDRWEKVHGAEVSETEARRLLEESVVVHDAAFPVQDCKFFMVVDPSSDRCVISLLADTAYLPLPTVEKALRGVEAILLAAAYRDLPVSEIPELTGLRPPRRRTAAVD